MRLVVGATFAVHAGIIMPAPDSPTETIVLDEGRMSLYVVPLLSYEDVFGARSVAVETEVIKKEEDKKAPVSPKKEPEKPKPKITLPIVAASLNLAASAASSVATEETPPAEVVPPAPSPAEALPTDVNGPDFALSAFSHFGAPVDEGQALSFSVVIENKGKRAEEKIISQLFLDRDNNGTRDIAFSAQEISPLGKGETEMLLWKNAWTLLPGTHHVEVCADVGNHAVEADEGNNCLSLVLSVGSKMDNADLFVSSVVYTPTDPKDGVAVTFRAEVGNQGKETATTQQASLYIDGSATGKKSMSLIPVGEKKMVEWITIWKAVTGNHTYEVCADSGNRIQEPNEENNCTKGQFSVTP